MKNFLRAFGIAFGLLVGGIAAAAPLPYVTGPQPASDLQYIINNLIQSINTNLVGTLTSASGTTTATASSAKNLISVTGLTTAAGSESAAMVVTNTTVVAASTILCQVNGYSGTGKPLIYQVTAAAGSYSFTVLNVATSGSLNATVPVFCRVSA